MTNFITGVFVGGLFVGIVLSMVCAVFRTALASSSECLRASHAREDALEDRLKRVAADDWWKGEANEV